MREMKDSGIEWIGEIPKYWEIVKNKYFAQFINGYAFDSKSLKSSFNVPVIRIGDITDKEIDYKDCLGVKTNDIGLRKYRIKDKDIVIAMSGATVGKTCSTKEFVAYILLNSNGSAQPNFSSEIFKNYFIPNPSEDEQQAIANFLDAKCADIDSLTGDIQKQIEILKEYKKSVITQAVTKGLDPNVEMKNTASPYWNKIPKKWCLSDIKYIFKIVKRIAGKEGFDILSVTQKGLKIKDTSRNEGQIAENYKGYQFVYPGDFVMNHMDLLTGWVDLSKLFGVTSPDYRVFKLRDNIQNEAGYYKYVMQCCYSCRIFYSLGQGVSTLGRWRLQTSVFNNFLLPVPPTTEQKAIADFLDAKCADIDVAIAGKQKQLDVLKEYKKSLIYEYVTGKKEVPCRE